jgi:predicted TIM-barrel fold metal-dependent hydrolase
MTTTTPTRLIATLESYLSPTIPISPPSTSTLSTLHLLPPAILTKLRNLGTARARDMRALGHTTQIISHLALPAPTRTPPTCAKANDALHTNIGLFGERFAGLALLPADGADAARELLRCVSKYRFVGGVVGGAGADGGAWEGVWEAAHRLGVPVVLRAEGAGMDEVSLRRVSVFREG